MGIQGPLCNGPATFSRLMDAVLAGLTWQTCFAYLDNVIISVLTWTTHFQWLREVFD